MSTGASPTLRPTAAGAEPPRGRRGVIYVAGVVMVAATALGVVGLGTRRASQARAEAGAPVEQASHGGRVRVSTAVACPPLPRPGRHGQGGALRPLPLEAQGRRYPKQP